MAGCKLLKVLTKGVFHDREQGDEGADSLMRFSLTRGKALKELFPLWGYGVLTQGKAPRLKGRREPDDSSKSITRKFRPFLTLN